MNDRILPSFALVIAGIIFFAYVNTAWSGTIANTKAAIAADDQALASADTYIKQQNKIASARDAIDQANLDAVATFLPGSVDNVGLILDLNALAARSGISVANIDVVTETGGGQQSSNSGTLANPNQNPIGSVDLSLSAVGTFSALQMFLNGVEKSARLLDVHDLVVKGSDTGVYTYQMSLRLYWLR